ncbi:fimbrial protein [Enterobacter ludwigii]|uniref:fimbrial protein n=1 Tax=unclassified Enterobacter TaxID=2608935 RepID=UPI001F023B35|nr:fimbrial protein [Enterobacter sp. 23-M-SZ-13]MCF8582420.1 fimbrial protein [Enterobacter ludwigii]MDV0596210.1 fimbrial protein [Enterobacter sp. 23-M-SZ-13]
MKLKHYSMAVLACVISTGLSVQALASSPNLQITGTILSRTCDVASDSQNMDVDMGQFSASSFTSTGATSPATQFNIHLTGCGSKASGAKMVFSGTSDATNPALLALSDTSGQGGMASGVAIEILDNTQQPIAVNTATSGNFPLTPGDVMLPFYLRYKSTQNSVTPGNASAVMYFDIQYQ